MSIRRLIQIIAFVSALAFAFASPLAGTAYAGGCDPMGSGGLC
jgi:hypothetical protein